MNNGKNGSNIGKVRPFLCGYVNAAGYGISRPRLRRKNTADSTCYFRLDRVK